MPDFVASLNGKDLGHLEIIAELWGIELESQNTQKSIDLLHSILFSQNFIWNILKNIPDNSRQALSDLVMNQGRMRWSEFRKRYGDIRDIGAGKRDREKPYLNHTASSAEILWYRGLIGRAFFDTTSGLEEFIYIPEDILNILPFEVKTESHRFGRLASKLEFKNILPARDLILEDACTLLAGLRIKLDGADITPCFIQTAESPIFAVDDYLKALQSLLFAAGLLDENNTPKPVPTREFLELERGEALLSLFNAWIKSETFNELFLMPGIKIEGEWKNDPKITRQKVLDFIGAKKNETELRKDGPSSYWWSLPSIVSDVKADSPDYQRPAGDYDSWYIRNLEDGEYLRGFESWEEVDGNLIYYLVSGPLFWLGCVDLGLTKDPEQAQFNDVRAFRLSQWANDLFNNRTADVIISEKTELLIGSDARVHSPEGTSRALRYHVSRFCQWEGYYKGSFHYRITPSSLDSANQQGLTVDHLLGVLSQYGCEIPPKLVLAMKSCEKNGPQVNIQEKVLLKVNTPEILSKLRNTRAARFFDEPLGPTVIVIKSGAWQKVAQVLAELGYLADIRIEN